MKKKIQIYNLPSAICNQQGQSFILMLLVVLPLLLLVLGAVYDLGNVAAGVTIAQNAADLAAQEAGKMIDVPVFVATQEIRLRPEAAWIAQQIADGLTNGAFQVQNVSIVQRNILLVEGHVTIRTPFLDTFIGLASVRRPVQGIAQTAHGTEREGE